MKLISLENLKAFLAKVKSWVSDQIAVVNKRIDKQIFHGTQAELEAAIKAGTVDENTIIILTDAEEQSVYELCEESDIKALFPAS